MASYHTNATFIGQVASVASGVVRVKLRSDLPSASVIVNGISYRIGQIGSFLRIALGYTSLYAVCTQVGADAMPSTASSTLSNTALGDKEKKEDEEREQLLGYRWITVVLCGEGVGKTFERGVGQYPTIGDEVHLLTDDDLSIIYGRAKGEEGAVSVGSIAAATGFSANINIAKLVSRHCTIVGSTGSGKSNLVTVLLDSLSSEKFPSSRTIVIDLHGEYATALGDKAKVFRIFPDEQKDEKHLWIPFWTLPIDELIKIAFGGIDPNAEVYVREKIVELKIENIKNRTNNSLSKKELTADTPVSFSIRKLWHTLDTNERATHPNNEKNENEISFVMEGEKPQKGDAEQLMPAQIKPPGPGSKAPFLGTRRHITRQLAFMKDRLKDPRYSFLFNPGDYFKPNEKDGNAEKDIDKLVSEWIGHDKPISIFDVSGLPSEILPTIVGTMLRVIYEMLFWAQGLPVSGHEQPLLIVIEEAHRFFTEKGDTPAHRTLSKIAKEGRKYGVGLTLVSQRPSDINSEILSQSGSFIAMRLTNEVDQSKIRASVSDDLGGLVGLLPSLRTGEGLFLGEIMPIPSRVRVREAKNKPVGDDPKLPQAWQKETRPDSCHYAQALSNWRRQSFSDSPSSIQKENSHESSNT